MDRCIGVPVWTSPKVVLAINGVSQCELFTACQICKWRLDDGDTQCRGPMAHQIVDSASKILKYSLCYRLQLLVLMYLVIYLQIWLDTGVYTNWACVCDGKNVHS